MLGIVRFSIDHIDPIEAGCGAAMRNGTYLRGLSLAVVEGAKWPVVLLAADLYAGIPEFLGVGLVGYIVQHAGNGAILNGIEYLSAKLKVIPLLVDGVRPASGNVNAILHIFDHILQADVFWSGFQ